MTGDGQTSRVRSTVRFPREEGVLVASRFASEVKDRWCHGERPDAAGALEEHPQLNRYKTIALDLAHDEYRRRVEAGESLDAEDFSRRFPTLQRSLYLLIEIRKLLDQDSDFQALEKDGGWPGPGESFLGFSLLCELGRGTFGRVFLASEPALGGRLVALKVAPHGGEEAEMLGKLRHPNIVPVYSVQADAATELTAVCMPYLGRATLCDVLDQAFADSRPPASSQVILDTIQNVRYESDLVDPSKLDRFLRSGSYVEAVIQFATQLADALAYAHSRGICHRDLKPSNVLVSLDGRPLLLDFNLSSDEQLRPSKIGGTLPYMAPEQLRYVVLDKLGRHVDPRSDVFSLGAIIYELLCGSLPFGVARWDLPLEDVAEHLLRQQEEGPEPIREKNPQVDKPLAQLIESCLAFDPEGRPKTSAAVAAACRRQLAPVQRVKRWVRSHRRSVSYAFAALLVLLLAGVCFLGIRDLLSVRQFKLGVAYSQQGDFERAIDCYNRAISWNWDADYREAWFNRGRAYQMKGDFRSALRDFEKALELAPTPEVSACEAYCLNKLGLAYSQEGDFESAIDYFDRALSRDADCRDAVFNRGRAYQMMGRFRAASDDYRHAFQLDKDPKAIACLGYCLSKERDHEEAKVCYRYAIDLGYASSAVYNNMGYSYIQLREEEENWMEEAESCLNRAVEESERLQTVEGDKALQAVHHNLVSISLNQARKKAREGKPIPGSTVGNAVKSARACPDSAELLRNVAELCVLAAKEDAAIDYLKSAVQWGLDPTTLHENPTFSSLGKQNLSKLLDVAAQLDAPAKVERLVDPF